MYLTAQYYTGILGNYDKKKTTDGLKYFDDDKGLKDKEVMAAQEKEFHECDGHHHNAGTNRKEDSDTEDTNRDKSDFLFDINYKKKRRVGARLFMDSSDSEDEINYVSSKRNQSNIHDSPETKRHHHGKHDHS